MPIRLGTRGSALAVAQATTVARSLERLGEEVELVRISTSGDERAPALATPRGAADAPEGPPDAPPEDKTRFVKEIEQALLAGEIKLAVHSAKDVPAELPDGLAIVGVPAREDVRDALCVREGVRDVLPAETGVGELEGRRVSRIAELPSGARVGTASLRRRSQVLALRDDLDVRELRGNVDSRLRRLEQGELDAIVLAAAGLRRLGRSEAGVPIASDELVPAAGQGCLALEARLDDERMHVLASRLTDRDAEVTLTAERALVVGIGATCHTPVGAHAAIDGDVLRLRTYVGAPDGSTWIRDELTGPRADPGGVGRQAADRLLAAGARDVLDLGPPSRL